MANLFLIKLFDPLCLVGDISTGDNQMPFASFRKTEQQNELRSILKNLPLFANLPAEDIAAFSDAAQARVYNKKKLLYIENQKAEYFYIILSGWIRLFHTTDDGEEINLAILTSKSTIGESALFENGLYPNSAEIAEDAHVLSIPLSLLEDYMRLSQQMAFNMLTVMTRYQRQHTMRLEMLHLYTAPQRIGCFLLSLCPVPDQAGGVAIDLPYDKSLIASTLGMQGATFSRALNVLRQKTGIHIQGASVTIASVKRLMKFVDGCQAETPPREAQIARTFANTATYTPQMVGL